MKNLTYFFVLLCNIGLYAQQSQFGKVTEKEISETIYSPFPEAEAAIMYQYSKVYINNSIDGYFKDVYVKIKIYDKDKASDYLSNSINLHKQGGNQEKIIGFKGVTYNLENGKIVETKISKDQIFEEEKSKYTNTFKYTFSNVKNGSVLECKYSFFSPYFWSIDDNYFQHKIPVTYAEFHFTMPEPLKYTEEIGGEIQPSKKNVSTALNSVTGLKEISRELIYELVPGLKDEAFVINTDNLKPQVSYELASVEIPGQLVKNYSMTWPDVHKSFKESDNFGSQIKENSQIKELAASIVQNAQTPTEKAEKILNYVQENFKWNNFNGAYTENGVNKTLKEHIGNVADINIILVDLLKAAGLNAYPVLISTVGNGYINPAFPSNQKFNYVLAGIKDDKNVSLIDATSPYTNINQLPRRCLSLQGFLFLPDKFEYVEMVNTTLSRSSITLKVELDGNQFKGKYLDIVNNYYAISKSEDYADNKTQFEEDIKDEYNNTVSDLVISQDKDKFQINYDFTYSEELDNIGGKLIFNPMLFLKTDKQIFVSDTRSNNLEFGTPFKDNKKISIAIPAGYEVESLPTNNEEQRSETLKITTKKQVEKRRQEQ